MNLVTSKDARVHERGSYKRFQAFALGSFNEKLRVSGYIHFFGFVKDVHQRRKARQPSFP